MRKTSFIKFGVGFWNIKLVFIQGHPTTVFSEISVRRSKNCLEFSIAWGRLKISRWLFHSCTIFEAYLMKSLRLSQDGFFVISFIFSICFFFHFCFRGLIRSKRKKFVERNNFTLFSTVLCFFDINLIYFSCDGRTALEEIEYVCIAPRIFTKWQREW